MPLTNGLAICMPTSISSTGSSGSATLNSTGSVSFTTRETVELRGVFSADYDNYVISLSHRSTVDGTALQAQLLSGTSPATGANYGNQYWYASGTSVTAARLTGLTYATLVAISGTSLRGGDTVYIFGPYLAEATSFRSVNARPNSTNMEILDLVNYHSLSTSYDGIKIGPMGTSGTFTGSVTVYGFVQ